MLLSLSDLLLHRYLSGLMAVAQPANATCAETRTAEARLHPETGKAHLSGASHTTSSQSYRDTRKLTARPG